MQVKLQQMKHIGGWCLLLVMTGYLKYRARSAQKSVSEYPPRNDAFMNGTGTRPKDFCFKPFNSLPSPKHFFTNNNKMADSWNKKEREKKKQQEKKEKAEKKKERKEQNASGKGMDMMIAYVDENGVITSTPPDPSKRKEIKLEDIEIGVPEYVPPTEAELTHTGKVSFFNHEKGFGFIRDQVSQESFFVHINNLTAPVKENDKVSFEIGHGPKGPVAVNVKLLS